ncbi:MAG TPA: LysR family transcriptional regulator [candidate division Zixibacteria bacterium]|nr:LysR family transcriptional regulator [candidate division Zixibacteria bacterium]
MELKQLKAFLHLSRKGNLGVTASLLRLTPAGVSLRLKRLERELGVKLFERKPNRLLLTGRGRVFSDRLSRIMDDLDAAVAAVRDGREDVPTDIEIAAGSDTAFFLGPHLAQFAKRNPCARVSLLTRSSAEIIESILDGRIHLGVGWFPSIPRDLACVPVLSSSLVAICPKSTSRSSFKLHSIQQIASYPLVVLPHHSTARRVVEEVLARKGLELKVSLEAGGCLAIKQFVRLGLGIGLVHDICVSKDELSYFVMKDLRGVFGQWQVSLVFKKNQQFSPAHESVVRSFLLAGRMWTKKRRDLFRSAR